MFQGIRVITTKGIESMLAEVIIKRINEYHLKAGDYTPPLIPVKVPVDDLMEIEHPVDKLIWDIAPLLGDKPVLLLTDLPIYYADLDYVFGFTDMLRSVSIVSLARLTKGATVEKIIERAVKTAIHEIGHLNGLRHCNRKGCVMSLSFSLRDTDRKSSRFCDRCYNLLSKMKSDVSHDRCLWKRLSGGLDEVRYTC